MQEFLAQDLMHAHPPMIGDRNKRGFRDECPKDWCVLEYRLWDAIPLPRGAGVDLQGRSAVCRNDVVFDYVRSELLPRAVEWHVNFADLILFGAYGTAFFAQDEIQVAGHPSLVALEEALAARDRPVLTVEDGSPTPVLVAGVEHSRSGGN